MSQIKNTSVAERARAAVSSAYEEHGNKSPSQNPIFTQEMFALLQEQDVRSEDADPLCLFRYFMPAGAGEWYVYGAERMGAEAVNVGSGQSAASLIQFEAFACLGDPSCAECGTVPLDKASGMGLRDIRSPFPGLAAVELDRYYRPEHRSAVMARFEKYAGRGRQWEGLDAAAGIDLGDAESDLGGRS